MERLNEGLIGSLRVHKCQSRSWLVWFGSPVPSVMWIMAGTHGCARHRKRPEMNDMEGGGAEGQGTREEVVVWIYLIPGKVIAYCN